MYYFRGPVGESFKFLAPGRKYPKIWSSSRKLREIKFSKNKVAKCPKTACVWVPWGGSFKFLAWGSKYPKICPSSRKPRIQVPEKSPKFSKTSCASARILYQSARRDRRAPSCQERSSRRKFPNEVPEDLSPTKASTRRKFPKEVTERSSRKPGCPSARKLYPDRKSVV